MNEYLQSNHTCAVVVNDFQNEHRLRNQESGPKLVNAPSDNFQSFLQVHALLPVSVEHRQYEAGSVSVSAEVDLGEGSHVVHVVQRHPILRVVSGQQKVGLIRTFSEGSGQL